MASAKGIRMNTISIASVAERLCFAARRTSLVVLGSFIVMAPVIVEVVGPEEIPRVGFRTWSLFLVCTPDWVMPDRSADLANLYRRFKSFGDAIGNDNAAVWFWKKKIALKSAELSENIDVARSAAYCKALALRPSEGPFLVVTTAYPELSAFPQERAVFSLGSLPPAELAKLLNTLTDQLLIEGKVSAVRRAALKETAASAPGSVQAPPTAGFWVELLESTRRALIGVGCAVSLKINTGVLTAELRECSA